MSVVQADAPLPIRFNAPAVNVATKADPGCPNELLPLAYDTDEHFSVYAMEASSVFNGLDAAAKNRYYMSNEECAYDSGFNAWAPLSPFYWLPAIVGTYYMNFQAYSPTAAADDITTLSHSWDDGFTFTGFTPRTPGQQYDLLYSDRVTDKQRPNYNPENGAPYDDDSGDAGSYSGIDLHFHHSLSAVLFNVKAKVPQDAIQQIHLQKLSVKNVWNKGTFTQSTPAWSIDAGAAETAYVVYQNTGSATQGLQLYEEQGFVSLPNKLMIIPQDLLHPHDALDPDDDIHIVLEITYTRTIVATGKTVTATETADLVTGNNGSYFQASIGSGAPVVIDSWDMGHCYTYNLTLNLYKVFVDPTIKPWTDFDREHDIEL